MNKKIYAVITGDIIGSTELTKKSSTRWVNYLNNALMYVGKNYEVPLVIYRGDSFQGVTSNVSSALKDTIILRLNLISSFENYQNYPRLDARIAIGVGKIDSENNKRCNISEMTGEAFTYSGRLLSKIEEKKQNLGIKTPWYDLDSDFDLFCLMADRLINKWTKKKCEAIMYKLNEEKSEDIGMKLDITSSAVSRRLEGTDYDIVEKIISRYSDKIKKEIIDSKWSEDKENLWKSI